jgi:hypothetical protein
VSSSDSRRSGLLLLCEVALGESNELLRADYNASNLPPGKFSTKGVSGQDDLCFSHYFVVDIRNLVHAIGPFQ